MALTETRTRPPQFIEDIGVDLSKQLVASTGIPTVGTGLAGISQQGGESAADFAARQNAARAFETRKQSLSGLAPQVAGQDVAQTEAYNLARSGVGSYQPFLNEAQSLTGAGGGTGAGSIQEYMSPYQSQVMEASLSEFDRNAAIQRKSFTSSWITTTRIRSSSTTKTTTIFKSTGPSSVVTRITKIGCCIVRSSRICKPSTDTS